MFKSFFAEKGTRIQTNNIVIHQYLVSNSLRSEDRESQRMKDLTNAVVFFYRFTICRNSRL